MKIEQAIINILEEQISTYRSLHSILGRERECLVKIDTEMVTEISKEKDTVVMRLRLLEEERIRLIEKYAGENNLRSDINLKDIGKLTGNEVFLELRTSMKSLLQTIEEMNKFNSILIERSLNYLRNTTNYMGTFTREEIPQSTGTLLSRET